MSVVNAVIYEYACSVRSPALNYPGRFGRRQEYMRLSVGPVVIVLAFFLLIVWFFRYEYVTRTLNEVSCVERVNRYTKERCLISVDVPRCRTIITTVPCER